MKFTKYSLEPLYLKSYFLNLISYFVRFRSYILNLSSYSIRLSFYILFLTSYFLLLILSCSKDSPNGSDNTVTVSGTVTLEGQSDHSGVTVRLYRPVQLDAELTNIMQQYPQIGVQSTELTGFNHLDQSAVYSATSGASGNWSARVAPGNYNVVAEKVGYGWRYGSVNTNSGSAGNLILKPDQNLSGGITGLNQFENDFLNITGNLAFDSQAQLQFSGQNHIYFTASNLTATIQGQVTGLGNGPLYVTTAPSVTNCKLVFLNLNSLNLSRVQTNGAVQVTVQNCKFSLSNSIIVSASDIGLRISASKGNVTNCLFANSVHPLSADQSILPLVEHNIFFNNNVDFECNVVDSTLIKNNMFNGSNSNLDLVYANINIEHNAFKDSNRNIQLSDLSKISINNNQFNGNENNVWLHRVSHVGYVIDANPNYNNFVNTQGYVFFLERTSAKDSVDATSNFWGTTSTSEIAAKIFDRNDVSDYDPQQVVIYDPYLFQPNSTAGIQLNK